MPERKYIGMVITLVAAALVMVCAQTFAQDTAAKKDAAAPASVDALPLEKELAGSVMKGETPKEGDSKDKKQLGVPGVEAVVKMLIWVGVIIVLIYVAVYLLRRYVPSARSMFGSGVLKIVGKTYVSSKQSILLVKVGGRFVMVGVTGTTMTPLAEISDPEEAKKLTEELSSQGGSGVSGSFKNILGRKGGDYAEPAKEDAPRQAEVEGLRNELDEVRQKVSWWRRQSKS